MSTLDIIKRRRSVRTFENKKLSQEDIDKILDYASRVTNPYNLEISFRILDADEYGLNCPVIVGCSTYIAGKMKRTIHSEEAFGYAFEKIILFCEENGIGTTWIAGTMNRDNFEKAIDLKEDEVMPCVSPLGYKAKKMSLREGLMRKGIKADSRMPFEELFFNKDFNTPLERSDASKLELALEAVRLAPSAINKQPWRVVVDGKKVMFFKKGSKGYVSSSGWDIQKIDMGIAMCHFELVASEEGINYTFGIEDNNELGNDEYTYIASYCLDL